MYELAQMFPTADALLALEPDALGAKILASLCKRGSNQNQGMFNLGNLIGAVALSDDAGLPISFPTEQTVRD